MSIHAVIDVIYCDTIPVNYKRKSDKHLPKQGFFSTKYLHRGSRILGQVSEATGM